LLDNRAPELAQMRQLMKRASARTVRFGGSGTQQEAAKLTPITGKGLAAFRRVWAASG
jgi:hypothetical protein